MKVAGEEGLAERREQVAVDALGVAEADLDLGRVNVDVDLFGRNVQVQKRDRVASDHEEAAVGFAQSVAQRSVANRYCPLVLDRLWEGWAT